MKHDIRLDRKHHEFSVNGVLVHLAAKQWQLTETLMSHPGQIFTRKQLMEIVWKHDTDVEVDTRTVDQHIARTREAIRNVGYKYEVIETVHGFGYRAIAGRVVGRDSTFDPRDAQGYLVSALPQDAIDALMSVPPEARENVLGRVQVQMDEAFNRLVRELLVP